jgi:hypothetical protein
MGGGMKFKRMEKFPMQHAFSLEYLWQYCQEQYGSAPDLHPYQADFLNKVGKHPDLVDGSHKWPLEKKYHDMFMGLLSFIRSPYTLEQEMIGISKPHSFEYFYTTAKLDEVFGKRGKSLGADFFKQFGGETYLGPTLFTYGRILKEFYNAETYFNVPVMKFKKEDKNGLISYYDLLVDMSFTRIIPVNKLPELSPEEISDLANNFYDLDKMIKALPPQNFLIKGFSMVTVLESTGIRAILELKDKLMEKDAILSKDHFSQLQKLMQSILNLDDLKMGVAAADFEAEGFQESNSTVESLLVDSNRICENFENSIYQKAVEGKSPVILHDLDKQYLQSPLVSEYRKKGYKSLIVFPLLFEDRLVGILELASYKINGLNNLSIIDLHDVIPAFSIAAMRISNDMRNKVKAKIQEEFTAIHSVVEWKFNKAASQLLDENGETATVALEPIIFKSVHPLYGAVDIRASSRERNNAIIRDLQEQLDDAYQILEKAWSKKKMPVFSQLNYQINNYRKSLKKGLLTGDETRIIEFLRREVEPVFKHFKTAMPDLEKAIKSYDDKIDPEHGMLYKRRNDFEISIGQLTDCISAIIDEQELSAQQMFPHYFEKYRTDGIEYNIYVGQSLLEEMTFDPVYLKNLRLWELIIMCQIARKTEEIKSDLPIPLDTTQMVLVHSNPLDIRFRQDEKKFDVEGGYNIRYEIIKKRIDKAVIKGTDQRLTQPGTIAIIYSQPNEYYEYKKYLDYLKSVNYIMGDTEEVELEEMQGVFGLQALRVKINYKQNLKKELNSMDEIVKEAGKKIK